MSPISQYLEVFGFHTKPSRQVYSNIKGNWCIGNGIPASDINTIIVLGYIPIIGTFIALGRRNIIIGNQTNSLMTRSFKAALITRSVFEGLGLGILLLIPDLIVSIVRIRSGVYSLKAKKIDPL